MSILDYEAFEAATLQRDPYDHLVVPGFIRPEALETLNRDYPAIEGPGSYPIEGLAFGPAFEAFWKELQGPHFRSAFERKFGVDLTDHPIMATVREYCQATDGDIHTDSRTKIITILFYFNPEWPHEGGRLRVLRSADDIEDYAAEVEPSGGTLLAFRRSKGSFHGHLPFEGRRRMLQMHWVDPKRLARNQEKRRSLRWRIKKALRLG